MSDRVLDELVRDALQTHRQAAGKSWLVSPSAPVLFFGDLSAYRSSPLRIATVALNPSRQEFPAGSPFSRFPGAASEERATYLSSLEGYFRVNPYRRWFDSYEHALLGLRASYYGQEPNAALHTDIGSVLATNPTWGKLEKHIREHITDSGVQLWHRLIEQLKPHVLLWSTAKSWLALIKFDSDSCWNNLCAFHETQGGTPRKRPVIVRGRWYRLQSGAKILIAFIPAAQKPLGKLSNLQKRMTGESILRAWKTGDGRA